MKSVLTLPHLTAHTVTHKLHSQKRVKSWSNKSSSSQLNPDIAAIWNKYHNSRIPRQSDPRNLGIKCWNGRPLFAPVTQFGVGPAGELRLEVTSFIITIPSSFRLNAFRSRVNQYKLARTDFGIPRMTLYTRSSMILLRKFSHLRNQTHRRMKITHAQLFSPNKPFPFSQFTPNYKHQQRLWLLLFQLLGGWIDIILWWK